MPDALRKRGTSRNLPESHRGVRARAWTFEGPLRKLRGYRQVPAVHVCPAAHCRLVLQRQNPSSAHESDRAGSHAEQTEPPRPQLAIWAGWQTPPRQHPAGQLLALHDAPVQAPPAQVAPSHDGKVPQRQRPSLEQLSALFESHSTQVEPPAPHSENEGVLH